MTAQVQSNIKSIRVIAASASDKLHRTVQIISSASQLAKDVHKVVKQYTQLTSSQAKVGIHETVQDGSALRNASTFPTIYINGYTAPN